jgi:hypothetical protein
MVTGDAEREGGTVPKRELPARSAYPPKGGLDDSLPCNEKRTRVHAPAILWWWLKFGGWLVVSNNMGMLYPASMFTMYTAESVKRVRVCKRSCAQVAGPRGHAHLLSAGQARRRGRQRGRVRCLTDRAGLGGTRGLFAPDPQGILARRCARFSLALNSEVSGEPKRCEASPFAQLRSSTLF